MIMSGMTITTQREEVVDFTYPFWEEASAVVVRVNEQPHMFLTKPLRPAVWLCLFITGLICMVSLAFTEDRSVKLNTLPGSASQNYSNDNPNQLVSHVRLGRHSSHLGSPNEAGWYILGGLLYQSR